MSDNAGALLLMILFPFAIQCLYLIPSTPLCGGKWCKLHVLVYMCSLCTRLNPKIHPQMFLPAILILDHFGDRNFDMCKVYRYTIYQYILYIYIHTRMFYLKFFCHFFDLLFSVKNPSDLHFLEPNRKVAKKNSGRRRTSPIWRSTAALSDVEGREVAWF